MRIKEIDNSVRAHYVDALKVLDGKNMFGVFLQGSQNYNLDIYTDEYRSDVDTKCIVLPSFEDFCKGNSPISTTYERENKEHIDLKDIRVMFDVFKKQNVNFVEILFTDFLYCPYEWQAEVKYLRNLGEALTHAHPAQTCRTMAGMSMEKRKALCHPYPTILHKIEKYGYDGKQLHHIIRINDFIKRYVKGEPFKSCLTPSPKIRELLFEAKLNKFSLEKALELAEIYDKENNKIKEDFIARDGDRIDTRPYKELDELKVEILRKHFKKELNK